MNTSGYYSNGRSEKLPRPSRRLRSRGFVTTTGPSYHERDLMNKSLLVLLLVAGTRAAMAGTRATALRRPRPSHRHYHEAPGYVGAQPKLGPTLQEALSAARQYKKQNVKKAKLVIEGPQRGKVDKIDFVEQFDACIGTAGSGPSWEECEIKLAPEFDYMDEASGWAM